MRNARTVLFGMASFLAVLTAAGAADAAWIQVPSVGPPVYLDTVTGLQWTVTLGRVPSSDWGNQARAHVQQLGFRLPTFNELQVMYNFNGGGGYLQIRAGLLDYYETADPNVLGNAFGNGFQTPLPRQGIGYNWYLGVK